MEVGEEGVLFRFVFVLEVAALYHCPFNPASMPLLFIIVHANQKNLTAVIFQAIQIILSQILYLSRIEIATFQP